MAGIVILTPLTDHGKALIDRLERVTGDRPSTVDHGTEDRTYHLGRGGLEAFEALLDELDPGWREHIARSATDR